MALPDERSGEQSRLPPRPAKALSGRDPEKLDPPVSIRCRELGVSEVRRQSLPQDLGSADSRKAVTCGVFSSLPPSGSRPRRPQRNSVGVVVPIPTPMLVKYCSQLNKVCFNGA